MHNVLYFPHYYSKKGLTLGLKENVDALKQELSTEEQFLESVIKAEGFFKKYKTALIAALVTVVAAIVIYLAIDYIHNRDLAQSNQALAALLQNPADEKALKLLREKNEALYEVYRFSVAAGSMKAEQLAELAGKSKDPVLRDLATYQANVLKESAEGLDAYSRKQDALLKEVAILDEAYLFFSQGKNDEARKRLAQIPLTSQLQGIVQSFAHYLK